jgi:uncharacterized membrane protein
MQLIDINKECYRKHLNAVIVGFIISLLCMSLLFGTILISLFSTVDETNAAILASFQASQSTDKPDLATNFRYNLLGVIIALLANIAILQRLKRSHYFKEIYYVWQLKQRQNLIYRKFNNINTACNAGDKNAFTILYFYYQSQLQVYQLDDNTLTLLSVEKKLTVIKEKAEQLGYSITDRDFDKILLANY